MVANHHWQHGHTCGCIGVLLRDGKTPEMGRCPEKQHNREQGRDSAYLRINNRGTGEHGKTSGRSADNDIQPGTAFKPNSVNNRIEKGAKKNVQSGHAVE